jgi:hypothetical protein
MADAYTIISGSIDQKKSALEFEDTADGSETIDATVDAGHIAIIINDEVLLKSRNIDALIRRMADALKERGYT